MNGKVVFLRRADGGSSELSDEALVAACAAGDSAALGTLFDRYFSTVYRFLARITPGRTPDSDLEDMVQTTFLEIHRSADKFKGMAAVKTWILGIAANVSRHHIRGEIKRRRLADALVEMPTDPEPRPDAEAERSQLLALLSDALDSLDHNHKVAFIMCDIEGVSGVEAAQILGVRPGTLWRRLHEARKELADALERKR